MSFANLVWLPAHTAEDDVGSLTLSDGTVLTHTDRIGNKEADRLAKRAAKAVAPACRDLAAAQEQLLLAEQLARGFATVTLAASSFAMPDGTRCRDAAPTRRYRQEQAIARRERPQREPRPPALGGHVIFDAAGRLHCQACNRSSANKRAFVAERCPGSAAIRWARLAAEDAAAGRRLGSGHP